MKSERIREQEVFNRCENSDDILLAVQAWENVHLLLKVIPVEWNHSIPYGLLHSPTPSRTVKCFLSAIQIIPGTRKLERLKENTGSAEVKLTAGRSKSEMKI